MEDYSQLPMFNLSNKSYSKPQLHQYRYVQYFEENGGSSRANLEGKRNGLRIHLLDKNALSFPSDSFLHVKFIVEDEPSGGAITQNIALTNNIMNIFKRARYSIDGKEVDDQRYPGAILQCKGLLEYSDDYEKGQGNMELWYPDRGSFDSEDLLYAVGASGTKYYLTSNGTNLLAINSTTGDNTVANDPLNFFIGLTPVKLKNVRTGAGTNPTLVGAGASSVINTGVNGGLVGFYSAVGGNKLINTHILLSNVFATTATAEGAILENTFDLDGLNIFQSSIVNTGHLVRKNLIADKKAVSVHIPLRQIFPFLRDNPIIMTGMDQVLEFDMNDMEKTFIAGLGVSSAIRPKIILTELSWYVPLIEPSDSLMKKYMSKVLGKDKTYQLTWGHEEYYMSNPYSTQQANWVIHRSDYRCNKLIVFFQLDSKVNSIYNNNMVFDNMNLSRLHARLNSNDRYPHLEYDVVYDIGTDQDYSRVYSDYLKSCDVVHSCDRKPALSYDEFRQTPLYVFDFTPQYPSAYDSNKQQSVVTVEWRLSSAPAENYRVHAILETERAIKLKTVNNEMRRLD